MLLKLVVHALPQQAEEDGVTDVDGGPLDIKEKMDPWIDQIGYPLVNSSRIIVNGSWAIRFTQEHFLDPDDEAPESPFEYDTYYNDTIV